MDAILSRFVDDFGKTFAPPLPGRGVSGTSWLISKVWSDHMRAWLQQRYRVTFEVPINGRRLDAALRPLDGSIDSTAEIALEWEWDNNKVASDFPLGDFRKVLDVAAKCGLAIVQTRADGRRGVTQADGTIASIRGALTAHRRDDRSVALIEIRRMHQDRVGVDFGCLLHDFSAYETKAISRWAYPLAS